MYPRLWLLKVLWQRMSAAPGLLGLFPDDWSAADRAAKATVGERHIGQRPEPSTTLIVVGERPGEPQKGRHDWVRYG